MLLPVSNEYTFYFSSKGSETGFKYEGTFKVKCLLNIEEKVDIGLRTDAYNRGSKTVSSGITIMNSTLAELDVRIIESPSFWKDSDYGRKLLDTNIIYEVFSKANDSEADFKKRLTEAAESAEQAASDSVKAKKEKRA